MIKIREKNLALYEISTNKTYSHMINWRYVDVGLQTSNARARQNDEFPAKRRVRSRHSARHPAILKIIIQLFVTEF